MADTGSGRTDPFADMISLVAGPIAAVIRSFDQLRRGAEELMRGLENFNSTMENLNETAARVNRLLNDFEEPIRAMLPQLTRTVKLADELSLRLATPIDQVVPGLTRLADTLNSPVLRTMPTDLGQFMEVINDLATADVAARPAGRAGRRAVRPAHPRPRRRGDAGCRTAPAPVAATAAPPPAAPARPQAPARKAPAKKRAAPKAPAKKAAAKKRAPAKRTA